MALGRILVVDDEAPVREVLAEYFATEGYAVESAGSGLEALTVIRGGRADLVLLDVRMPGLDGVQVLRRIRELNEHVPVIMVTANEDVGLAKETLKLGAFDYVAKPFDFDYLDRAVAAGLARVGERSPASHATEDDRWEASGAHRVQRHARHAATRAERDRRAPRSGRARRGTPRGRRPMPGRR